MGASLALAGVSGCAVSAARADHALRAFAGTGRARQATVLRQYGKSRRLRHGCAGRKPHGPARSRSRATRLIPPAWAAPTPSLQASILGLYDPDRSAAVVRNGRVSTWNEFVAALAERSSDMLAKKGEGLRILSGASTSPTIGRLLGHPEGTDARSSLARS